MFLVVLFTFWLSWSSSWPPLACTWGGCSTYSTPPWRTWPGFCEDTLSLAACDPCSCSRTYTFPLSSSFCQCEDTTLGLSSACRDGAASRLWIEIHRRRFGLSLQSEREVWAVRVAQTLFYLSICSDYLSRDLLSRQCRLFVLVASWGMTPG